MAPSLRRRLTKRGVTIDVKNKTGRSSHSSEDLSRHSSNSDAHNEGSSESRRNGIDVNTPSPDRKLVTKLGDGSRVVSPPQKLLDRYKGSKPTVQLVREPSMEAREAVLVAPYNGSVDQGSCVDAKRSTVRQDSFNEEVAARDESRTTKEFVDGTEFDIVNQYKSSNACPSSKNHGTSFLPMRKTRSQIKKEDEKSSNSPIKQCNCNKSNPSTPPRKTSKAQSPPGSSSSSSVDIITQTPPSAKKHLKKFNIKPAYIPITPSSSDSSSPSPDNEPFPISKMPIKPPPPPAPFQSLTQIWTSASAASSRPSEPWGFLKKWQCCRCAAAAVTSGGRTAPAQTMIEQRVCARLSCGHERCGKGCRIVWGMYGADYVG